MGERVGQIAKVPEVKQSNSNSRVRRTERLRSMDTPVDRILYLQRTAGNQAVSRLMRSGALQAELRIGQPGDVYEQEADRVAEAVMRMPEPGVQRQVEPEEEETLQSKPLANQITSLVQIQRQEEPEEEEEMLQAKPLAEEITPLVQRQVEPEEEEEELQAKATSGHISEANPNLESDIQSLKGGGKSLSENDRAFFEPRFGRDFSQVRVHTDTRAAEAARAVNARAFTVGRDVAFGTGQYVPGTSEGRRLLAHELTHVIQQRQACTNPNIPVIQRNAFRCCREVRTGGLIMDTLAGILGLEHCWLRTDTKVAGMGPAQAGPLPAWPFGIPTRITDHSEDTPTNCREIPGIDENCVNQELQIGRSTGPWGLRNNCNTLVEDIIDMCRERRAELDRRIVRSGTFRIELVDGADPVNLAAESQPYFEVRSLPAQHSLRFRWIIADDQDRRYLMWGDQGQVFRYGAQYCAYIPSRTRALLRERNIREATILCRVTGGGVERLIRLPVRFVW